MEDKKPRTLRAVVINVPIKVGRNDWIKCWNMAKNRSAIFGLNESLIKKQRDTYAELCGKEIGKYGLRKTPNPVFWKKKRFRFVSGEVHLIHGKATGWLSDRYPGFNAERTLNEVVLRERATGMEVAVLNTHWVPNGRKVSDGWRFVNRRRSIRMTRRLVRKHIEAGREVIFMGDTNYSKQFAMPKGFGWYRGRGIDKLGGTLPGRGKTFRAPTDHKHGIVAIMTSKEKP